MEQEDRRQFEDLYKEYLVPLKKLAVRVGIRYDDIEDIVHDTLIIYFERYPLDWSDKQKKAMLARILHSRGVDNYRKNQHYSDVSVDDSEDSSYIMTKLLEKDALTYVMENETYRAVRKLIDEMKPDWRDVIILYIIDERPIKEVCEILDISGTVCRSRISRARKHLKSELINEGIVEN